VTHIVGLLLKKTQLRSLLKWFLPPRKWWI